MLQNSRGEFFLRSPKRRRQLRHRRTGLGDHKTDKQIKQNANMFEKCQTRRLNNYVVVGFMVSQPCASVSQLPAALRRPQKKHAPGFVEHVSFPLASFGCLWSAFGAPWADFGLLLTPLGTPGLPLVVLWAPAVPFGVPLGSLWPAFGVPLAILGHMEAG